MHKMIPQFFLSLNKEYSKKKFIKDIISGIIVGIIALPLSIALAIASGATPETGLITAIFAGFTAALLGGSKTQISGPTGAFIVIVFGIIAQNGFNGLILATFMAGIIIIIMGLLNFGKLIRFIPLPVITGFTAGIAVTIFIGQLNDFLGLQLTGMPAETLHKLSFTLSNLQNTDINTLIMGMFAILIIKVIPKFQKILPGPLSAIIICTVINLLLVTKCITLGDIYGTISLEIKPSFSFFDVSNISSLILPAFTIAFLASIESLLSAVVADGMTNSKHNPKMELIGQGCANLVSPVFGGLPATGAIARTSANIRSGASTPVSAITHSVVILLLSLFLMPLASYIPMTVFAAILIVVCYNMFNIKEVKKIIKSKPSDILFMILTFTLTITYDLVVAILVCAILSFGYQVFNKHIRKKTASREQMRDCIKVKGCLCYMNCEEIMSTDLDCETEFDMLEINDIDATATEYLLHKTNNKHIKIKFINNQIKQKLKKHKDFDIHLKDLQ